jgi:hypothetical protein
MLTKISLARHRDRPLDPTLAWVCVVTNQLVTPGLGTVVAGRLWMGLVELAVALAGFTLIMKWFFELFSNLLEQGELVALESRSWLWKWGLLIFGIGWALALVSSLRILSEARRNESGKPPRLSS